MPEATIAAGVVRRLLELSVAKGAGRTELERLSGLKAADLADQDARVPFNRYAALMRSAKQLCRDPALALHFGEAADLSEISIVGLMGSAGPVSMMDGIAMLNRYSRLVVDVDAGGVDRFEIVRDEDGAWLTDRRLNPNDFPELTESTFARMATGPRRLGEAPFVRAVEVTHADPGYRDEYDRILGAPTTFLASRNALLVEEEWLARQIPAQRPYVFNLLSARADDLLGSLDSAMTVRGRVESVLAPILHTKDARIEFVARKMGVSRWTLSRRLKAESVTFEGVLDDLRRKMAMHYLSAEKASVREAAFRVGFSEPAAFSRAFKRWTGARPSQTRDRGS